METVINLNDLQEQKDLGYCSEIPGNVTKEDTNPCSFPLQFFFYSFAFFIALFTNEERQNQSQQVDIACGAL